MNIVTPIFPKKNLATLQDQGGLISRIKVPEDLDDHLALQRALEAEGLLAASRGIWMGFPSLRDAADKLIEQLTVAWPSQNSDYSAAIGAIVNGIKCVEDGLNQGESSKQSVVANFLNGLSIVGSDVAHVHAWGIVDNHAIEIWSPTGGSFHDWVTGGRFDEVRFYRNPVVPVNEVEGTRWKIMCAVASVRDIGMVAKLR